MTENPTTTEPVVGASTPGASVEHGADASLDRLNLEQALIDFEVANRRVIDLARRVSSLQSELLQARTELAARNLELESVARLVARLRRSPLAPLLRFGARIVRGLRR